MGIENLDYSEVEARLLNHADVVDELATLREQHANMSQDEYNNLKRKMFAGMYGITKGPTK